MRFFCSYVFNLSLEKIFLFALGKQKVFLFGKILSGVGVIVCIGGGT
jgi:hypothetical protein